MSKIIMFVIAVPAPVNLTATEVMMTSVILTWCYSIDLIDHFLVSFKDWDKLVLYLIV